MSQEGEGPALAWVREYNAQNISLDDLADKIANHEFKPRKGSDEPPTPARALDYKDAKYQAGTFDDVYRAKAYGLLTKNDMEVILDRVAATKDAEGEEEPHATTPGSESANDAPVIELKASSEPYLLKVEDRFVKVQITL